MGFVCACGGTVGGTVEGTSSLESKSMSGAEVSEGGAGWLGVGDGFVAEVAVGGWIRTGIVMRDGGKVEFEVGFVSGVVAAGAGALGIDASLILSKFSCHQAIADAPA